MAAVGRIIRRAWRGNGGAELIELAVALPILLLVIAGIVDFGILFKDYEVITNAAREGARVGVLVDYTATDVQNRAKAYLAAAGLTDTAPTPTVTYSTVPISAGGPSIDVIKVVVQYPHRFIFIGPAAAYFGGTSADIMLASSSTMRRESASVP
jgi:Flp pilus assembly protein TadG